MTDANNDISLSQRMLPGVIALLLLLVYYIVTEDLEKFYPWLGETLVIYASWFFLLRVIVKTVVNRKYDPSFTVPMLIGVFALVTSVILFGMTPEEIILKLINATIIWSLIYTMFGYVKTKVNR